MTVWTDNAHAFASRDRDLAARLVLSMARRDALDLIVAGRRAEASERLQRGLSSAGRILGVPGVVA